MPLLRRITRGISVFRLIPTLIYSRRRESYVLRVFVAPYVEIERSFHEKKREVKKGKQEDDEEEEKEDQTVRRACTLPWPFASSLSFLSWNLNIPPEEQPWKLLLRAKNYFSIFSNYSTTTSMRCTPQLVHFISFDKYHWEDNVGDEYI